MSCFRPFEVKNSFGRFVQARCGRCIGCIADRKREWTIRLLHESRLHRFNCVVTLTFDAEHLPAGGVLDYKGQFVPFMKRFREWRRSRCGNHVSGWCKNCGTRFFVCGEYGADGGRPHYHAVLFNFDFQDKVQWNKNQWTSATLTHFWRLGLATVGVMDARSASYVAGYVTKKALGSSFSRTHYVLHSAESGELLERRAEFVEMSRNPGIGAGFFDRFESDMYPHGKVVFNGVEQKAPRYYDRKFAAADPEAYERLQEVRDRDAVARAGDNTASRLAVREAVALGRARLSKRGY